MLIASQKVKKWSQVVLAIAVLLTGGTAFAEEDGLRLSYKAGDGLKIGGGGNLVHIQGRVQPRFTYESREGLGDTDTFAIQRGKIKIEGHTLDKLLLFGFQMNLATRNRATTATVCTNAACTTTAAAVTVESTQGLAVLEDFYVDYVPFDYFGIKVGQFKVPFLKQELTSSGKQQFVDRSLSTGFFNFARDIGVTLHGNLLNKKVQYDFFAMNGDGINNFNRNQDLLIGTRFEFPILGTYASSESDVDNSQEHNLGVGIAYAYNEAVGAFTNNNIVANARASHGTLDVGYKYRGFSFQGAGMINRSHEIAKLTNFGYNAQVGYFFIPKKFEVALRTNGAIFPSTATNTVNQFEHALALNHFIIGHGLKIQHDYSFLPNASGTQDRNDHRFRSQLQLVF